MKSIYTHELMKETCKKYHKIALKRKIKDIVIVTAIIVAITTAFLLRAKVDLDAENGICSYCGATTEKYDTTFINGTQYDKYMCENGHDITALH